MSKKAGSVRHQASVSPIPSHEALFGPIRIGAAGGKDPRHIRSFRPDLRAQCVDVDGVLDEQRRATGRCA